jgi:hypothetical protein
MQNNMILAHNTTSAFCTTQTHVTHTYDATPTDDVLQFHTALSEPRPSGSGNAKPHETVAAQQTPRSAAGPLARSPKGTQCSR